MPYLIDTCGWIEWLTDGTLVNKFSSYFEPLEQVYVPTSVQFELYKWVKREADESRALETIALTEQSMVVPLDTAISLVAAKLSAQHQLSFADAIIYATAQQKSVPLITSDSHFVNLPDVVYFPKTEHP